MGLACMDWIDLVEGRDQRKGSCELSYEPLDSIKCWEVVE
jgi:hypothetical protein